MMTAKTKQLSPEQRKYGKTLLRDPVLFAQHFLNVELWEREVELLRSIATNRRTAIRACHAVGKTFTLAVAALWWLARYEDGIVLTTSPTQRQVRTQLWSEIHRLVERAKVPYTLLLRATELKLRGKHNFAIGFSTDQAANFQGYHGKHVLIIADEAPGIESGIWDAIAGTMAGGVVHIVMAGNPTIPSGAFFDAFTQQRGLWNCISIGAFDSPNLNGFDLEQLLSLDPAEGGPLDHNPYAYLVTRRWVYEQYSVWWHGSESSSPNWLARVLARFPDQAENALFQLDWLERTKQRALQAPINQGHAGPLVAGVDVGGGAAETVVYVCELRPGLGRVVALGAWRGEDTRGRVVNFLQQFRGRLSQVRIDSIGMGNNFALHLRDRGLPVDMVNVALPCEHQPQRGDQDPALRFANLRAWYYQTLADLFERDQIEGLTDERTLGQLAGILYEIDSQGRLKLESKEKARARGVLSPDRADALMLALGKPFESGLPLFVRQDRAWQRRRAGQSIEQIACALEATVPEVNEWLAIVEAARRAPLHNPFRLRCANCNEDIEDNVLAGRQGSRYFHSQCPGRS